MEYWKRVLFSDECSFNISGSNGRIFVWRKPGEEFRENCIFPKFSYGKESVMIWGCISWNGTGKLHICEKKVNADYYMTILQNNLPPSIKKLKLTKDFQFLQDNAPPHKAGKTQLYLKNMKYHVISHPAQSPDLNPIEHV